MAKPTINHKESDLQSEKSSFKIDEDKFSEISAENVPAKKAKEWEELIKKEVQTLDRNEWNWKKIRSRLIVHPLAIFGGVAKIANIGICGILEILLAGISGDKDGGDFKEVMTFLKEQRTDPSVVRWSAGIVGYSLGWLTGTDQYVREFFKDQDASTKDAFSYFNAGLNAAIRDIKDMSQSAGFRTTDSSSTPKAEPSSSVEAKYVKKVDTNRSVSLDNQDPNAAAKNTNENYGLDSAGHNMGG